MLDNYNDFLLESIDTVTFTISDELEDILNEIDSPIASALLEDSDRKNKKKVTLLNIHKDRSFWYFVNSVKAVQLIKDKGDDPDRLLNFLINREAIELNHQAFAKVGKLIRKIYPDTYEDKVIEDFVNQYKTYFINGFELMEIVTGDKISYWYNENRYFNADNTVLGNSCMAASRKNEYMKFYDENKNVSMIIMYSDDNKQLIQGRALLWKLDTINGDKVTDKYFMDRVYSINEDVKNTFRKYAIENGFIHKKSLGHGIGSVANEIIIPGVTKIPQKSVLTVSDMQFPSNMKYPFADTFHIYDFHNKILLNNAPYSAIAGDLSSQRGLIEDVIWSEYYDTYLDTANEDLEYAIINENGDKIKIRKEDIVEINSKYYEKEYAKQIKNNEQPDE